MNIVSKMMVFIVLFSVLIPLADAYTNIGISVSN